MRYPSWKTVAALLVLTACSSDSTAPPGLPTLYSISVSLATTTLPVGQSTQAFATLATDAKTLQFQLARAMARKKPLNLAALDDMATAWQAAIDGLSLRFL